MERMKDFRDEIDRLVGEYIVELEEENKKLKSDLAFERTMLDNVKAEYENLQNVIKELKDELSKYKKQHQHPMGFSDFGGYYLDNNK